MDNLNNQNHKINITYNIEEGSDISEEDRFVWEDIELDDNHEKILNKAIYMPRN